MRARDMKASGVQQAFLESQMEGQCKQPTGCCVDRVSGLKFQGLRCVFHGAVVSLARHPCPEGNENK